MKKIFTTNLLLLSVITLFAQFQPASFTINGNTLPYRIMFPENYDETKQYPLVLFLHGAGERGNDNEKQLTHGKQFLIDNFHRQNPAIVIVPQCPATNYWSNVCRSEVNGKFEFIFGLYDTPTVAMQTLMDLVNYWVQSGYVNRSQVYVGGLSMGSMGTFELLWRMPQTFAAAFPICGGADVKKLHLFAKNTALWIFHGDADSVVPVQFSRTIYSELKKMGCDVRYTEYKDINHNSWDNVFQEKTLGSWLFHFKR